MAKKRVKVGRYYAHFKHPGEKEYQVVDIGILENGEEICVIYKSLTNGIIWIRTLGNFLERVDGGGRMVNRFTKLERE